MPSTFPACRITHPHYTHQLDEVRALDTITGHTLWVNHLCLCNKHPRLSGHNHCFICSDLVSEIQVGFSRSAPQCSVILGASAQLAGMAGTGWDGLGLAGLGWDWLGLGWDGLGLGWDGLGLARTWLGPAGPGWDSHSL